MLDLSGRNCRDGQVRATGATVVCSTIVKKWSDSSTFWTLVGQKVSFDMLVGAMTLDGAEIDVYDNGVHALGTGTCGALAHSGWVQVG
jgi:hypothetical protein